MEADEGSKLLGKLWEPTPETLIAKLPRYKGSRDTPKRDRQKGTCDECGSYHELPAFHLDYLGHSDTCRILASVDLLWQWVPNPQLALEFGHWQEITDDLGNRIRVGTPVVRDRSGYPTALFISLTVLGVSRPGIGTVEGGKADPEKELIGDAIRNAAMRFGVGADLWSKAKGGGLDDATEGTYDRAPEQASDPDAWFSANGWQDRAEHHAWKGSRIEALKREAADNPDEQPVIKQWIKDHKLDLNGFVPRSLADAFDDFMVRGLRVPAETPRQPETAPPEPPTVVPEHLMGDPF